MSKELNLSTVCQEARCPNIAECWEDKTATFMLMGDTCTRACRFCSVKTGNPKGFLDPEEPQKIAHAISQLELRYVVLTSVDRDDLPDLGSQHFASTIQILKSKNKKSPTLVEALIPDFQGRQDCLEIILNSQVDVLAHNLETVRRLNPLIRDKRANYDQSLGLLKKAKLLRPSVYTKTSLMLGLGEKLDEVYETLKELRSINCDVVTFGQYLTPGKEKRFVPVLEFVRPRIFEELEFLAKDMGFLYVASGPLVRSSYKAAEHFLKGQLELAHLKQQQQQQQHQQDV